VIEDMLGIPWDRPVRHLREYLDVLMPLLEDKQVAYKGETISCQFQIAANVAAPAVLVAALGEQMLRLAGSRTSGTITWMTGPKTLAGHTVPILREAAGKAGRAEPVVVAGFPLCVTADADAARARAAKSYAVYGTLPSYRAMLEREGAAGPEDVALAGDESAVTERLAEIEAAGATEIMVSLFGRPEEKDRSRALLASLARRST
jgi:F420-dependent oxidoreductase-like protein